MIPANRYKARAVDGSLAVAGTGTENVAVLFSITSAGEYAGYQITWYGYLTDAAIDRTLDALRLCGWEGDDLNRLTGLDRNEVEIVIEHEEDLNGKTHAKVKWVNGPGGLAVKNRLEGGAAQAVAQRLKGHVLAHRQRSGVKAPSAKSAPANTAPMPSDDDMPF